MEQQQQQDDNNSEKKQESKMKKGPLAHALKLSLPPPDEASLSQFVYSLFTSCFARLSIHLNSVLLFVIVLFGIVQNGIWDV